MIAKSDVVILLVSASALAGGIYRWQHNMASLAPVTASVQQTRPATAPSPAPVASNTGIPGNSSTQDTQVVGASANQNGNQSIAQVSVQTATQNAAQNTQQNVATGSSGNDSATAANSTPANTSTETASTQANTSSEPLYGVYVVQSGDYLGKIAGEFNTTVDTLRTINGIVGSLIDIGQEIRYPLPAN